MEYMLDLDELRWQLDWMAKEGCDVVFVTGSDGSDNQPLAIEFGGGKRACPLDSFRTYLAHDIRGEQ